MRQYTRALSADGTAGTPTDVALEFVRRINLRSPCGLAELMTADHLFIDSLGERRSGRDRVGGDWGGYLARFPDYEVEVERTFADGDEVILLGRARGTYAREGIPAPDGGWAVPAAWRAVVRRGLVAVWQVYADNSPVVEIIARADGRRG